ncbi:hypothetical protein V1478_005470 [Vespula squamosa]|uniref:Uncharacterized protein n=1 Tax=Vespula squamosa TaxID=30214 RepID=A0ABD2BE93_VESSQ
MEKFNLTASTTSSATFIVNGGGRKIEWIYKASLVVNEDGVNDPLYFHVNCHPLTNRDSLNSLELGLFRTSLRLSKLIGDQTRRLSVNLQGATKTSRNVEESASYFTSDVHCLVVDEKRMRTTRIYRNTKPDGNF